MHELRHIVRNITTVDGATKEMKAVRDLASERLRRSARREASLSVEYVRALQERGEHVRAIEREARLHSTALAFLAVKRSAAAVVVVVSTLLLAGNVLCDLGVVTIPATLCVHHHAHVLIEEVAEALR